jgi:hypothetical protein
MRSDEVNSHLPKWVILLEKIIEKARNEPKQAEEAKK